MTTSLSMEEDSGRTLERELLGELPRVRAFLNKLASGRADLEVEDLLQETVTRALRYRESFDPRRTLGPWLRKLAFRVFLDSEPRRTVDESALAETEAPPHERDGRLEREETVQSLLRRLNATEREVLVRFHRDEQPIDAIAKALGLPVGTVKSHLHRARRRLAEEER